VNDKGQRETEVLGEKFVSVPLDPLQTPHRSPWDLTQAFVKRLFGFMSRWRSQDDSSWNAFILLKVHQSGQSVSLL